MTFPYPSLIPLGTAGGRPNGPASDFAPDSVKSASDLPISLFGCNLKPETFETLKGNGSFLTNLFGKTPVEGWKAKWESPSDTESSLSLSWTKERGWRLELRWFGESLGGAIGYRNLNFGRFSQYATLGLRDAIFKNPGKLRAIFVKPNGPVPSMVSLPDGLPMELLIPVPVTKLRCACELFQTLPADKLPGTIKADLAVTSVETPAEASDPEDRFLYLSSLAHETTPETGSARRTKCFYALRIIGPYHELGVLLDHFAPVRNRFMEQEVPPITGEIPVLIMGGRIRVSSGNAIRLPSAEGIFEETSTDTESALKQAEEAFAQLK